MSFLVKRRTIAIGACALGFIAFGLGTSVTAGNNYRDVISEFTNGKKLSAGKIKLRVHEIAENGSTVPLNVSVESPMTENNYVKRIMLVADRNPAGKVVTFNFTPQSGVAEVSTRIRLAKTQNVIAVAEMSDGTFYTAKKNVKVTLGGCGGGAKPRSSQ